MHVKINSTHINIKIKNSFIYMSQMFYLVSHSLSNYTTLQTIILYLVYSITTNTNAILIKVSKRKTKCWLD